MRSWWACLRRWFSQKKSPSGAPAPDSGSPVQEAPGLRAETFQRAVERLLEDEALTANLVDDAAEYLLAWGKEQVRAILTEEAGATEGPSPAPRPPLPDTGVGPPGRRTAAGGAGPGSPNPAGREIAKGERRPASGGPPHPPYPSLEETDGKTKTFLCTNHLDLAHSPSADPFPPPGLGPARMGRHRPCWAVNPARPSPPTGSRSTSPPPGTRMTPPCIRAG